MPRKTDQIRSASWALSFLHNNSACSICGNQEQLCVHHFYSGCAYPEYYQSDWNGVVLCRDCHSKFHKLYGNLVTEKDFAIFYTDMKNGYIYEKESERIKGIRSAIRSHRKRLTVRI